MTADTEAMTLAIARRILADPTASADRVKWADDAVLWIEFGDLAASKRCGHTQQPDPEKAAA
jgi:hypothetical protein